MEVKNCIRQYLSLSTIMSKNRVGFWYLTRGFDPKNMSGYVTMYYFCRKTTKELSHILFI